MHVSSHTGSLSSTNRHSVVRGSRAELFYKVQLRVADERFTSSVQGIERKQNKSILKMNLFEAALNPTTSRRAGKQVPKKRAAIARTDARPASSRILDSTSKRNQLSRAEAEAKPETGQPFGSNINRCPSDFGECLTEKLRLKQKLVRPRTPGWKKTCTQRHLRMLVSDFPVHLRWRSKEVDSNDFSQSEKKYFCAGL